MSDARRGPLGRLRAAAGRPRPSSPRGPTPIDPAGLVDPDWYALQTGAVGSASTAWDHYVREGRRRQLSPHPLFVPSGDDDDQRTPFERALAPEHDGGRPFPGLHRPGAPSIFVDLHDDTPLELATVGGRRTVSWADLRPSWRRHAATWFEAARLDPLDWTSGPLPTPPPPAASSTTVSVVLATWNRAEPLVRAIESVRRQTHVAWQLLVVDDGSEDRTREVVQEICDVDDRVVLVPRPHLGVSAARNAGLRAATGELVAFLDSDNTWESTYLAHMARAFDDDPDLESAYAVLAREHEGEQQYRRVQVDHAMLRVRNHVDLNVLTVRAGVLDVVGGFDEALRRCVDYDLVLRLAARRAPRLVPVVGSQYDSDPDADRITTREAPTWPELVRLRHNVDWPAKRTAPLQQGVSLVLPVDRDTSALTAILEAAREGFHDLAWEPVVVDSTASPRLAAALAVVALDEPRLQYLRRPIRTTWPVGSCLGVMAARHDVVVVVGEGHALDAASLRELADQARRRPRTVVQPVVARNSEVVSTGARIPEGADGPEVLRHVDDVERLAELDDVLSVSACHALVLATTTGVFAELDGVDPLMGPSFGLLDLTLRGGRDASVEALVATRAVARRRVRHATVEPHPATRREFDRRHLAPDAGPLAP